MIFARGDRSEVEPAIAQDPFAIAGVARHTLVEFLPLRFGEPLDSEAITDALT